MAFELLIGSKASESHYQNAGFQITSSCQVGSINLSSENPAWSQRKQTFEKNKAEMYQQGQGAKEMALEISFTYVAVLRLFYHLQSGDKTSDPPLQNKLKSSQRYAMQNNSLSITLHWILQVCQCIFSKSYVLMYTQCNLMPATEGVCLCINGFIFQVYGCKTDK